jgi:ElaB/YqjD/DUF883 family membrane-anchored ribosome-binding protein
MSEREATPQETEAESVREGTVDASGQAGAQTDQEELRRDVERTRAELGDTVEALSQKADLRSRFSQRVDDRKAALRGRGQDARARATDLRGRMAGATPEDARRAASRAAHTAEERPFPAIGVAFGAGVLLGWLAGRR